MSRMISRAAPIVAWSRFFPAGGQMVKPLTPDAVRAARGSVLPVSLRRMSRNLSMLPVTSTVFFPEGPQQKRNALFSRHVDGKPDNRIRLGVVEVPSVAR